MRARITVLLLAACIVGGGEMEPALAQHGHEDHEHHDDHHEGEPGVIAHSSESLFAAGVEFAVAGPAVIRRSISLHGRISPNGDKRPLATVVIGGIISSTVLTLLVVPALYRLGVSGGEGNEG